MDILSILTQRIEETTKGDILRVTEAETRELYDFLNKNHKQKLPSYEAWCKTMVFLGWKLRIVQNIETV